MAEISRPGSARASVTPDRLQVASDEHPLPRNAFIPFESSDIETSLVARFERQAEIRAGKPAVRAYGKTHSYKVLNERVNQIAHALLERRGNSPEPIVLLMSQGFEAIAATLGILKAGKFYVPLDESASGASLRSMVEDCGSALLLTDAKHEALAREVAGAERSALSVGELDAAVPQTNPGIPISPEAFAYIFYTSGSTGRPKGVVDTHRNVLHNVLRYTNQLHIAGDDRLSLIQSPSFSGTVSSLFSALLNGATVCALDLREHTPDELAEFVMREGVTIYHSVPAIFRNFLSGERRFPRVRVVRLEGDSAARIDLELFRKHFGEECLLANGLGATETGLVRQFFADRQTVIPGGIVPIGYPVPDMDVLLLDEAGAEVEAGEVGEIAVRSQYLASGYWRNPELTEARFVANGRDARRRVYRTGDLGRLRVGGCLEHLGRKDFRVKVRGQTVEAGEVESRLQELREVRQAVVTVQTDKKGEEHLTAYVVGREERAPPIGGLRRHLAKTLQGHMIPSRYVFLAALPVAANGKVDRKALGAREEAPEAPRGEYVAARNETEKRLARMWGEVLGVEKVGVNENFFDLGGHSLLAGKLFAQIAREFGKKLPLSTILRAPTVAELATVIATQEGEGKRPGALVAVQLQGGRRPFFAVHGHNGEVMVFRALAQRLGEEQPFYALESLRGANAPQTVEEMAAAYVQEVRSVQESGPYSLGGYCLGGVIAYEMAQQLCTAGEEVRLLVLMDTDFPPAIQGPPFRQTTLAHWKIFRELPAEQMPGYLLRRVWGATRLAGRTVWERARSLGWEAGAEVFIRSGRALPKWLENPKESNRKAVEKYRPGTYKGQVVHVMSEEVSIGQTEDPRLCWQEVVEDKVAIRKVPGDVFQMMQQPRVSFVAEALAEWLATSQKKAKGAARPGQQGARAIGEDG